MRSEAVDQLLGKLADALLTLRLNRNLTQKTVAERSGVSLNALIHLESGEGASLRTFLSVCRTYGELAWLDALTPPEGPSPMQLLELAGRPQRRRASAVKRKNGQHG